MCRYLAAANHLAVSIHTMNLENRLGDVETNRRDRLHAWLPPNRGDLNSNHALAHVPVEAPPQHQKRTSLRSGLRQDSPVRDHQRTVTLDSVERILTRRITTTLPPTLAVRADILNAAEGPTADLSRTKFQRLRPALFADMQHLLLQPLARWIRRTGGAD